MLLPRADLRRFEEIVLRQERQTEFVALIEQSKKLIYKVCFSYGKTDMDRQDLFQEIVAELWRSFDRYDRALKFSTWLYRVALNTAISYARKEGRRFRRESAAGEGMLELRLSRAAQFDHADITALKSEIDRLSKLNKALILLHLEGHSHREIAEILGISESNVGTKLNRVKQGLQGTLRAESH